MSTHNIVCGEISTFLLKNSLMWSYALMGEPKYRYLSMLCLVDEA